MTNATVGTVTEAPQGKVVHVKFKDGEFGIHHRPGRADPGACSWRQEFAEVGCRGVPRRPEGRGRQRDGEFHVRREGRHQAADVTGVRDGSRMPWGRHQADDRYRRFPVVIGYSGERPFTEPIAATRLGSGNRPSCPHWHSRPLWRTRQGARQRHPRPGEEQNPLSCKYGPLSAVRAEGYTQFLGSIRPATGSSEPGPT